MFDGHPGILSYPFENEFFTNRNHELIKFQDFRNTGDISDIEKQEVVNKIKKFADDVLTSKQFYDEDSVEFNYGNFIRLLENKINDTNDDISDIYDAIHYAFFKVFLPSIDFKNTYAVSNHCSRTFLGNLDSFFSNISEINS